MIGQWAKLFLIFFKVGLFSFGGGYVMLPLIYQDIQTFSLMPAQEFSNVVALSQMTPGPIAVNAATYVGYQSAGLGGAIWATVGVSLPSLLLILLIIALLDKFKHSLTVQAILQGIRPATVGLLGSAVVFFANTSLVDGTFSGIEWRQLETYFNFPAIVIFALTLIAAKKTKLGPIALTILAGVAGALIG
ncbi:MAG: chromate transporter [Bacillota bacterium]|jgi:chromate transporter